MALYFVPVHSEQPGLL